MQVSNPPPAKYKLWIIVFFLVNIVTWLMDEAGFHDFLHFNGWLSPEGSLLFMLAIAVFCLSYTTIDVVVELLTFKIRGKAYGLGPWLLHPRARWCYKYHNFVAEAIAGLMAILEDGFAIFDRPDDNGPQGRRQEPQQFTCPDGNCKTILKIEHRICPEKVEEYKQWLDKIGNAAKHAHGILDIEKSDITNTEHSTTHDKKAGCNDLEEGVLHVIHVTFANIDYLNDWMISPRRKAVIDELKPILVQPEVVKVQNERLLPDAFTNLLTQQGQAVPSLSPKKWKVWFLTTIGLYITVRWTEVLLPFYLAKWGLKEAHPRVVGIVVNFISTFLNSYILTPLMLFLFNPWVKRQENENDTREPWRTLNDGFKSLWLKGAISFALVGGCAIAAAWHTRPAPAHNGGNQCQDIQGWYDSTGPKYNCTWYTEDACKIAAMYENDGYTANEACCVCGGGNRSGPAPTLRLATARSRVKYSLSATTLDAVTARGSISTKIATAICAALWTWHSSAQ
jgi:antibiotic biosynthesis monooxygenase (ABM) superfamily enzyme